MRTALWVVIAAVLAGCQKPGKSGGGGGSPASGGAKLGLKKDVERIEGVGVRRLSGDVTDLRATPDGQTVTGLLKAEKPAIAGVPPPMRLGELWAVPATGEAKKVASGVTNMPGGSLFSPDSRWLLVLAGYDPTRQQGRLLVQDLTALSTEPVPVSGKVTYFVPSADSKLLAWVEDGVLRVGPLPGGPFREVAGEVATAEFSPAGKHVYFRRRMAAAGGLFQLALDNPKATPRKVTDQAGDWILSADGARLVYLARSTPGTPYFELYAADAAALKAVKLAENVTLMRVSADGKWAAWLESYHAQEGGNLVLRAIDGGERRELGVRVKDLDFTADSARLFFRNNYTELKLGGAAAMLPGEEQLLEKVGDLTEVTLATGAARVLQKKVPNYLLSPDGKAIAFTARIERPEYTRHLYLLGPGQAEPVLLRKWLYDYAFSSSSDRLFFRANCTREGRSCDLLVQDVAAAKPSADGGVAGGAQLVAEATFNFKLSPDGNRVVYTYAHTMDQSFDVSVLNFKTGERKTLEQFVRVPVYFLGRDGAKVAYVVDEKKRAGLYVAEQVP